jgi:hypothetical protein
MDLSVHKSKANLSENLSRQTYAFHLYDSGNQNCAFSKDNFLRKHKERWSFNMYVNIYCMYICFIKQKHKKGWAKAKKLFQICLKIEFSHSAYLVLLIFFLHIWIFAFNELESQLHFYNKKTKKNSA